MQAQTKHLKPRLRAQAWSRPISLFTVNVAKQLYHPYGITYLVVVIFIAYRGV